MQASLQPRQSADDYELGMRIAGRDGKLWEVVMDQEEEWRHRWSAVRKAGQGKGGLGGTKRRRCGECSGCLAENCGTCGNCLVSVAFHQAKIGKTFYKFLGGQQMNIFKTRAGF